VQPNRFQLVVSEVFDDVTHAGRLEPVQSPEKPSG
jgi:hypothetical protein